MHRYCQECNRGKCAFKRILTKNKGETKMNKRRGKNEKSVLQMPLGKPIEKTMVRTIQRVLAIICIESVLLAGV